jgi:DNA-binding NarL/FixJ family response regulator
VHLVGREPEQLRIDSFVSALPDGAHALAMSGEPGIGKTTLWRYGIERGRASGFRVLVTRPAEDEMPLALSGLVDLFERVELDGAVLRAGDDPFVRGRAVLEEVRRLAADGPALIAVDDVQWLDSASARALRYALRRLDSEPVGVLAASRPGIEDPLAAAQALPPGRSETLQLGPLSLGALRRVLAGTVDSISRPTLRRIHEESQGNPLYAIELARALAVQGAPAGSWAGLPLPGSLQAAIGERLETVPSELTPLLETTAALGTTTVRELRELLPDAPVDDLLALAEEHALLVVEDDLAVRFAHPIVGSAVYERVGPLARRTLHARLAARAADPDVHARHLALSTDEPDAETATLLDEAARRATDSGSSHLAAEFARHSLRLTPPDETDAARRRALVEIVHLAAAGEARRALERADELVATLPAGPARVEALAQRVYLDLETGEDVLLRALAEAGDDVLLRGQVLDLLGWLRATYRGDLENALACTGDAVAIAELHGDRQLQMLAESALGFMEFLAGTPRPERMWRAVELADEVGAPPLGRRPRIMLARQRLWHGDLPGALTAFERMRAEFLRAGNEFQRPYRLHDLAVAEIAAGDLAAADEHARQGSEAAIDAGNAHAERWLLFPLSLAAACLGRAGEARSATARLLDESTSRGERPGIVRARGVAGLLALSAGDAPSAAVDLTAAAVELEDMGVRHPGAFPALPDAVEALARAGEVDAATALLERLEAQAAAVRSPWVDAALGRARAHALVDPAAAAEAFEASAAAFEVLGYRLDAARAALGRGSALIRAGRRLLAAESLAETRGRFAAMGAALWEARAVEELERASPGRAAGELTATEARVATLVARGLRNREIGQTLFMSVATVEAHLTRIYRKLEIRSRSELARLVTEGGWAVDVGESG